MTISMQQALRIEAKKRQAEHRLAEPWKYYETDQGVWRPYVPFDKQERFHRSMKFVRRLSGGNQIGKSESGKRESSFWCNHNHPFRKIPEVTVMRGRICGQPEVLRENIVPGFISMFPRYRVKSKRHPQLGFDNVIEIYDEKGVDKGRMIAHVNVYSYNQNPQVLAGVPLHFCWFDEPPPISFWTETVMRFTTTAHMPVSIFLTYTPLSLAEWMVDAIDENDAMRGLWETIEVGLYDTPHLNDQQRELVLASIVDPDERDARIYGKAKGLGGRVFKAWNDNVHVIPDIDYEDLVPGARPPIHCIMDPHDRKPPAIIWKVVLPNGQTPTIACLPREQWNQLKSYRGGQKQIVSDIRDYMDELGLPIERTTFWIDPKFASQQKFGSDESVQSLMNRESKSHGFTWRLPPVKDLTTRHLAIREALEPGLLTGAANLVVMERARNVILAFRRYKYKENTKAEDPLSEKIEEHWKDFIDCEGYFYVRDKEYTPGKPVPKKKTEKPDYFDSVEEDVEIDDSPLSGLGF